MKPNIDTRLGRYPNFDTVKPPPYFTSVYGITVNYKKNDDVRLRQRHQTVGLYLNRSETEYQTLILKQ